MVRDKLGVWDWHIDTALFNMDNQQGPTVYNKEFCSRFYNNPNGKRILKRTGNCVYIYKPESLCCAPETHTALLVSCVLCCAQSLSRVRLWNPADCSPPGSSVHGDSPGKNTGVGSHSLCQGIFPTQGSNLVSHTAGRFFTIWATREASL